MNTNTCLVCGTRQDIKYNYFSFPKDFSRRNEWLTRCNLPTSTDVHNAKLCNRHFVDSDFQRRNNNSTETNATATRLRLISNAVPSVFDIQDREQNEKPKTKDQWKTCIICGYSKNHSFFGFPKDPYLRQEWLDRFGLDSSLNVDNYRICNKHFSDSPGRNPCHRRKQKEILEAGADYQNMSKHMRLKSDYLPVSTSTSRNLTVNPRDSLQSEDSHCSASELAACSVSSASITNEAQMSPVSSTNKNFRKDDFNKHFLNCSNLSLHDIRQNTPIMDNVGTRTNMHYFSSVEEQANSDVSSRDILLITQFTNDASTQTDSYYLVKEQANYNVSSRDILLITPITSDASTQTDSYHIYLVEEQSNSECNNTSTSVSCPEKTIGTISPCKDSTFVEVQTPRRLGGHTYERKKHIIKKPRFASEITVDHVLTPRRAMNSVNVAKRQVETLQKANKNLNQKLRRCVQKLHNLQEIIEKLLDAKFISQDIFDGTLDGSF